MRDDEEVWFQDESRFGTHSNIRHGWFKKGSRTGVPVKLGYKNFYLYSAVNPETGEDFSLTMPKVSSSCMNAFLRELARAYPDRKIVLVMDGAAWHKSGSLRFSDNIRIIIQPPYSPELNPVEKLWQYMKDKTIKNKIYETLEDIEEAVGDFLHGLTCTDKKSICHVKYI